MKKVAFICVHNSCRSQIAEALGRHLAFEYARVSIPMAILIWLMIYPMMMKVDFQSIQLPHPEAAP